MVPVGRKIGTQLWSMGEQNVIEDAELRQHALLSVPPVGAIGWALM
jgi:hypothetical protein